MNLLDQAEADLAHLLEDDVSGFGRPAVLTDPQGVTYSLVGQYIRRGTKLDPGTGLMVAGDESFFACRLSTLGTMPKAGWTVTTCDATGAEVKGKVVPDGVMADRTLGIVTLSLKVVS